jgi:calcium/calmodulin-dependent protein kinase I
MTLTNISQQALKHRWLTGANATDKDLVKDLRSRQVRARFRVGIQRVQLAKRIEALKNQEPDADHDEDMPRNASQAATEAYASKGMGPLTKKLKGDIFRAVVLAKAREMKANEDAEAAAGR